jgi:hypothetical protein
MIQDNPLPGEFICGRCGDRGEHKWFETDLGPICVDCKNLLDHTQKPKPWLKSFCIKGRLK